VACPICGFTPAGLGPSDAIAALRSFPRRFSALIESNGDDGARSDDDVAVARAAALPAAEGAARTITALGADLRRVLVENDPALTTTGEPGPSVTGTGDDALDHLREATTAAAELASSAHGKDWERRGKRGDDVVTALQVLGEAVHTGVHHLHAATLASGH
jgi:hypothetical protein